MTKETVNKEPIDKWIIEPFQNFINKTTTSGIVLFSSALVALILANSPFSKEYLHFWETNFSIGFGEYILTKSLHHWINDGLMAVFFFVVGLELKREIVGGELSQPKNAILPIVAALGGMIFPALIYFMFNSSGEASNGWGIPMATDIAFALGVLYLLGDKVPLPAKIFLTVLAIADDIGAVLVIAFFYTSTIDFNSLLVGAICMSILIFGNIIGVRNTLFYGIIGICGLWLAFLMSGIHATIAAVLAAFTIPVNPKITEKQFLTKLDSLYNRFKKAEPNDNPTVTSEQLHILEEIRGYSKKALTPLQRLEHRMHPLVAFIIMPIFALCNAGVEINSSIFDNGMSRVTLGIIFGLIFGKLIGIIGCTWLFTKLKWASLPDGLNFKHIIGVGFLASIGFTMSLFITELAFTDVQLITEAKFGVLIASFFASIVGFMVMKMASKKELG
jgi:NhaA family Na+:H+ antiporter